MKNFRVAVVGATGLVGSKMIEVLAEENFPVCELIPCASERSVGKKVSFGGTGFFFDKAPDLDPKIEHHMPDYHLYDKW